MSRFSNSFYDDKNKKFQKKSNKKEVDGVNPNCHHKEQKRGTPKDIQGKTIRQKEYIKALQTKTLIVAMGCAGTGKTYVPSVHAANLYLERKVEKIVIVRPYVDLNNKRMGFLPGSESEKLEPYVRPMLDAIKMVLGPTQFQYAMDCGHIEVQALSSIRGRSFENAFIICDEMQCTTPNEIQAVTTRIGENSTIVICGDTKQNDIKDGQDGISYLVDIINKYKIQNAHVVKFTQEDIVRSGICKEFVIAYEQDGWK